MQVQVSFVGELLATRADGFVAKMYGIDVDRDVLFATERFRAVRTHEALFAVDHGRTQRRRIKETLKIQNKC